MQVRVVIIDPPGWDHAPIFYEMAELLVFGFQKLGHAAAATRNGFDPGALNVVLAGFHIEPALLDRLPRRTVFYNLEQVEASLFERLPALKPAFARFEVWDYSAQNVARLRPHAPVLHHLPIGTVPELTRIAPNPVQDIDVLFYGVLTDRRQAALAAMRQRGLNVHAVFGVYGAARDALIARSRIVLNMHKHDARVFETVRVSYLLANRKAVVAEVTPTTEIDPDLSDAVCGVDFDELPAACERLAQDDAARDALQERGFARMTARNEVYFIRKLLNERQKTIARRA
jgi:hypothetical protein